MDAVIFDLDGTLVDTLHDIGGSANHALVSHGREPLPVERYRLLVGDGARMLITRAAPDADEPARDSILAAFRRHYLEHLVDHTRPYPGIESMLEAMVARGLPLAVLSNKPDDATRALVRALFPTVPFDAVRGERAGTPKKPHPAAAIELARLLDVEPARCLFVGDTAIDIETARSAGMPVVAVLWGFRERDELAALRPDALVAQPAEIVALLDASRARDGASTLR
jgi:phosphoglycolate phosphatase